MEKKFDYIEFRIDTEKKLLYSKWLRNVTSEEYKEGTLKAYDLIEQNGIRLWMHNRNNQMPPLDIELQKWITEDFALLLTQSPVQFVAIVCSPDLEKRGLLQAIRDKSYRVFGRTTRTEFFDTEEEALAWLLPNMQHYRLPGKTLAV